MQDISSLYIENFHTGIVSPDQIVYPNIITSGINWNFCWKRGQGSSEIFYYDEIHVI